MAEAVAVQWRAAFMTLLVLTLKLLASRVINVALMAWLHFDSLIPTQAKALFTIAQMVWILILRLVNAVPSLLMQQ